MKVAGIIVEYNPLHNGHVHHIKETRRLSKCDSLVCVMSGNFTQRGEPAILDKFTRTKLALENGVDLVIELPFVFTVQNADIFAYTSVSILNHLGVDEIYFGSETGDINELSKLGDIMSSESYNHLVKKYLKDGNSYPTSSDLAMKDLYPSESFALPNNILGIQYILAGKKLNSMMKFHTIPRVSTNYYDEINEGTTIQSASAIRKLVTNKGQFRSFVPDNVALALQKNKTVSYEDFYSQIKYIIKSSTNDDLKAIFNINEGFENRVLKIKEFDSVQDLINKLLTRRYTNSKIKRSLAHILCNTKKSLIDSFEIPYIRILGMNDNGKLILNQIKHSVEVPLIAKVKEGIHPYLDHEIRVSKVYELVSNSSISHLEFKQPIL